MVFRYARVSPSSFHASYKSGLYSGLKESSWHALHKQIYYEEHELNVGLLALAILGWMCTTTG